MFKRLLPIALIGYIFLVLVNWSCTKLDTTKLGSDLIPAIDNVHTFGDTLDIETVQGIFDDSFKISRSENNILGRISNDPVFGQTNAEMFFQLKPTFFPYYFGNPNDSLTVIDSVVLCLAYAGHWGDSSSTAIQHLEVYKINDQKFGDSPHILRTIKDKPGIDPTLIGSKDLNISTLKDTIKIRKDSVVNQIRIKLDGGNFVQELFERDTAPASPTNSFRNDSLFRQFGKGFAVKATAGNAIMYISLTNAKTRLEVHFKKINTVTRVLDTSVSSFIINTTSLGTNLASSSSNFVERAYTSQVTDLSPAKASLHMVGGPGTYANLYISGLNTMPNRIIHRAEIYMEQEPDNHEYDSIFSAPYMYLDLLDTGITTLKWKPIYYDLSPNEPYDPDFKRAGYPYFPGSGGVDFGYFGGFPRTRFNYLGEKVVYYTLNATRHVQQIISKRTDNYTMRLYPAFQIYYPQISLATPIPYNNPLGFGRVRLKSGKYPDNKRKMRMFIVYSNI
ncbi:MAG: DUF4270 family protein [Rhizobacter sp.]|nr:DUF4270 family protein [Ferruginibacter sp.]